MNPMWRLVVVFRGGVCAKSQKRLSGDEIDILAANQAIKPQVCCVLLVLFLSDKKSTRFPFSREEKTKKYSISQKFMLQYP